MTVMRISGKIPVDMIICYKNLLKIGANVVVIPLRKVIGTTLDSRARLSFGRRCLTCASQLAATHPRRSRLFARCARR